MQKILKFMLTYSFVMGTSIVLQAFQIGICDFYESMIYQIILILIGYVIAFLLINVIEAFLFSIVVRFQHETISVLNCYPLFISKKGIKFSFNFSYYDQIKNNLDIAKINKEQLPYFIEKVKTITVFTQKLLFIISFIFLILNLLFKISLFNYMFFVVLLKEITRNQFNHIDMFLKTMEIPVESLIFSEKVSLDILQYYLDKITNGLDDMIKHPEDIRNINNILFAYYNQHKESLDDLNSLDKQLYRVIYNHNENIGITCRNILFEYLENRIVLGNIEEDETQFIFEILDLYVNIDWGIKLPEIYIERINKLNDKRFRKLRNNFTLYI